MHSFVDAQGGKLGIKETRLATVDLGNGMILRERFIIVNISSPSLAIGHIVRAAWELQHLYEVFASQKTKSTRVWREALLQVKMYKAQRGTKFLTLQCRKVHIIAVC